MLYVCASPIGNLEDCSYRLIETLEHVTLILAEDTRKTRILLNRFNLNTPCQSFDKYQEGKKTPQILKRLEMNESIALISDGGTPNASDPGSYLVRQCMDHNIPVSPIPGASAITSLLSICGINCNQFIFGGFFPKKRNDAVKLMTGNQHLKWPIIFFDTSKRLIKNLEWLNATITYDRITIAKEITKTYETIISGPFPDIMVQIESIPLKGEWCFIIEKPSIKTEKQIEILKRITHSLDLTPKQILGISKYLTNLSKNELKESLDMI